MWSPGFSAEGRGGALAKRGTCLGLGHGQQSISESEELPLTAPGSPRWDRQGLGHGLPSLWRKGVQEWSKFTQECSLLATLGWANHQRPPVCQVPQGSLCHAFQRKLQPLSSTAEMSAANMDCLLISSLTMAPNPSACLWLLPNYGSQGLSNNLSIASLKRCQRAAYRPSPILMAFV